MDSLWIQGFNKIWLDQPIDWSEESVVAMYNNWIEHVKKTVPSGKTTMTISSMTPGPRLEDRLRENLWKKKRSLRHDFCGRPFLNCGLGQLLIYNVKQGWEPLCQFLNLPGKNANYGILNELREWDINFKLKFKIIHFKLSHWIMQL